MDHTSGEQRAAELEATAEQRAERGWRLRQRAAVLLTDLEVLASAAASHEAASSDEIARGARAAAGTLDEALRRAEAGQRAEVRDPRGGPVLLGHRTGADELILGHGDRPPFAAELAVDRPPHER